MGGDFLPVAQVAGFVVGDGARRSALRWFKSDLREPFVNVFYFKIPFVRALGVSGIVAEKSGVVLQVGSAAGGVGDDGVEFGGRKLVDVAASQDLGELSFAVMGVE